MRRINTAVICLLLMSCCLPAAWAVNVQQGLDLYQQKQYSQAATIFQQVEKQQTLSLPQRVNMLYYRADALYRSGQTQSAAVAYRKVLTIAPSSQAGQYAKIALDRMEKLGQASPIVATKKTALPKVAVSKNTQKVATNTAKSPEPGEKTTPKSKAQLASVPDKSPKAMMATSTKTEKLAKTPLDKPVAVKPDKPGVSSGKLVKSIKKTVDPNIKEKTADKTQASTRHTDKAIVSKPNTSNAETPVVKKKEWTLENGSKLTSPNTIISPKTASSDSKSTVKTAVFTPTPSSDDTYLTLVDYAGMRVRWAQQPIPYYVDKSPKGMKSFSPAFVAQTERAFKQWQIATKNIVQLTPAASADQARILVRWSNQVDSKGQATEDGTRYTAGYTIPLISGNQLHRMDIRLSTLSLDGKTVKEMYPTALHEIGHALGLMGHSDKPDDVMFPVHNTQGKLSGRDVRTITRLYQQSPQISELPFKKPEILEQAAVDARRQNNLTLLEAQVKKDPSLTLLNQLADLYRREAEASKTQKTDWYQKALSTLETTEKKYPADGLTQLNKAVIASQLKNWAVADAAILKATQRLPDSAEVFLTLAEIKRAQKQYPEARNALSTYERLASSLERDTPRYRGVKRSLDLAKAASVPVDAAKAVTKSAPDTATSSEKIKPQEPKTEAVAFPALPEPDIKPTQDATLDTLP